MLRKYLIAGLLVWLPLIITGLVISILVDVLRWFDQFIPKSYQLQSLLEFPLPGIDVGVTLAIVILVLFVTGLVAANLFGRKIVRAWESLLGRIPLVRTVYSSAKQVAETIFSDSGKSFHKVMLIEYPRKGLWTVCFLTGSSAAEVQNKTGEEVLTVFVPTTPNPTSGFIIFVPKQDAIELDMNVDEALKMVISLGVIEPVWASQAQAKLPLNPPDEVA
ncbi:MAG: DUF502 domain-containing protein [Gammaproteobacteria bacterium]|nr:MAG: DUF502 domain-containing protein [Gammaproteobacteria bacterium]